MAIVLQDLSGIGQGIQQAGGALAQALQQRQMAQAEQGKLSALDQALASADFSTPEGKKSILRDLIAKKVPVKDALAIIDQYSPDPVDAFLNKYAGPQVGPRGREMGNPQLGQIAPAGGVLEETVAEIQQYPMPGRGNVVDFEEQQVNLFSQLPDSALVEAAASGDKRLQNMAEAENERRGRAEKRYESDRKYHSEGARPWLKKIDEMRQSNRSKSMAVELMADAIEQGNLEFFSKDNFANFLGRYGEGLRSPEGALLLNATKEFLLSNIQRAGSRPNQWIEQQISQMLTKIGRSDEANLSVVEALRHETEVEKLYQQETDRIADYYRTELGYVPDNIGALVDQAVEPLAKESQDRLAYRLREIKEQAGDLTELMKKKVPRGTPLTFEMMTVFADQYGIQEGQKRAKQLGYTIPSEEQYMRYSRGR